MVGSREAFDGLRVLASEIVLTHPFLRPGTSPLGAAEQRRRALSLTTSWVLVGLLHVIFILLFVIGIRPFDMRNLTLVETILTLPQSGNNQSPDSRTNPTPLVPTSPRLRSGTVASTASSRVRYRAGGPNPTPTRPASSARQSRGGTS